MAQEANYGDIILLCGDLHIGTRMQMIHEKIVSALGVNKLQHVLCTGNVGNKETFDWLKQISPNFHCVRGQYDDENNEIHNDQKVIQIGIWKILLIHGHQFVPWNDEETISVFLKENQCDIAVFGNSHQSLISKFERKYFINPGTMSGAYGSIKQDAIIQPEFVILECLGDEMGVYKYKLINGELLIEKCTITK
ncbi:unnamed protein product [Paramecium octaurelia]|uniref:Vacuolar protein sorting-associated protein 29 n=1 Tax=Paramecium octaurelia TaxID=43137 RepID=A0A8S1S151_PAROT|nr:unnamed protein product [Paramecium octaurelia]